MIFPGALDSGATRGLPLEQAWHEGLLNDFARHPSQLYQAALEGLALFLILQWFAASPRPRGAVAGLFLAGYGVFRLCVEFFREPDAHLGFLAGDWLTMGMLLSLPMILAGIIIMGVAYRRAPEAADPGVQRD